MGLPSYTEKLTRFWNGSKHELGSTTMAVCFSHQASDYSVSQKSPSVVFRHFTWAVNTAPLAKHLLLRITLFDYQT